MNNNIRRGVQNPDEIIAHRRSRKDDRNLQIEIKIERKNESKFLEQLNSVMDPNIAVPQECLNVASLRREVYALGHSLEKSLGFANLEKLGFSIIGDENNLYIVANAQSPLLDPRELPRDAFYLSVGDLFIYLEQYILNGSTLSFWTESQIRAYVKKGNEILIAVQDL